MPENVQLEDLKESCTERKLEKDLILTVFLCLETDVHIVELSREHRLAVFGADVLLRYTVQHARALTAVFPGHKSADCTHKYGEHHVLLDTPQTISC